MPVMLVERCCRSRDDEPETLPKPELLGSLKAGEKPRHIAAISARHLVSDLLGCS